MSLAVPAPSPGPEELSRLPADPPGWGDGGDPTPPTPGGKQTMKRSEVS